MSIKIMSTVWEKSPQKGSTLLLTLALADNANDDGYCFPGEEYLHKKIRMSRRQVVRLIALLEKTGEIFRVPGNGRGRKTAYIVATAMPFYHLKKVLMVSFDMVEESAILSSFLVIAKGCHFVLKGDKLSIERVTFYAEENGLIDKSLTTDFANFLERQPSLEPSLEPSYIARAKKPKSEKQPTSKKSGVSGNVKVPRAPQPTDALFDAIVAGLANRPVDKAARKSFGSRAGQILHGYKNSKEKCDGLLAWEMTFQDAPLSALDLPALVVLMGEFWANFHKFHEGIDLKNGSTFLEWWDKFRAAKTIQERDGWVQVPHRDPVKAALGIKMTIRRSEYKQGITP